MIVTRRKSGNYERDHKSGLLLPKGCRENQLRGPGFFDSSGGAPANNDIIRLLFNGTNGSTTFTDDGSAASTWAVGGGTAALTTTDPKEGTACLNIPSNTSYIQTSYSATNAITTDFFIGFWFKGITSINSKYIVSVQDAAGTAAGRAWIFYCDGSANMRFFGSDGTTIDYIDLTLGAVSGSTWEYWHVGRVGSSVKPGKNGTWGAAVTKGSALTIPAGQELRFGKPTLDSGIGSGTYDLFQMKRDGSLTSANFTAPTSPI